MKPNTRTIFGANWLWILVVILPGAGCSRLSEQIRDPSVGLNGGFEQIQSGLPVNWMVYTPSTIPTGSYELLFDRKELKEGEQSLRFLVEECSSAGGWRSPGIAQEFPATPGANYRLAFWIKSEGCDWTASFGGVGAKAGDLETVDSSTITAQSWQRVERQFQLPTRFERIRFELSIRSPGSLWIDDLSIAPLQD